MNAKHLVVAVAVLAATGSVFAQHREFASPDADVVSTRSRAEVTAEVIQARADGALIVQDSQYPVIKVTGAQKTQAAVIAETRQAGVDGTLAVRDDTYPAIQITGTRKTRADVRAELAEYRQSHPLGHDDRLYTGA